MPTLFSLRTPRASSRGVALIIVLAFVVLLTGLIVAFFSRALSERQISNSSATQTKVEFFAQGAAATIIGDLKQEIVAGSASLAVTPAPANGLNFIYRPTAPATAAPAITGFGTLSSSLGYRPVLNTAGTVETDGLNNVLKVSKSGFPFYPGISIYGGTDGPKRAAASPAGTGSASLNGRYVSLARWNKPLLMQAKSTTDLTPVMPDGVTATKFPTPDWILVDRGGNNPQTANSGVVGRYAYVIYNEGGLLDANVAGYPSPATTAPVGTTSPSITDQTMFKGSSCYADLTQLMDFNTQIQTASSPANVGILPKLLAQIQVDQLVGWRNNASARASGSLYGTYTYPNAADTATNFFKWATQNPGRFLTTTDRSLGTSQPAAGSSDRQFISRQQLIQFVLNGMTKGSAPTTAQQAVLQCLGTFSRTLNQPSLWPDPARPKVILKPSTVSNGNYLADPTFPGGNSAYSADGSLTDVFNPVFRKVRVTNTDPAILRNDGTPFLLGEPLVKKRFALSRVAWISYEGPSATAPHKATLVAEYVKRGMSQADAQTLLDEGTAGNIKNYFGLTWNKGPTGGIGGYWLYDHGIQFSGATSIGSLLDTGSTPTVVSANREADFFELLKAAVNVGSIGKDWAGIGENAYQGVQDSSVAPQILALGANIIDEASVTQFPTIIRYYYAGGDLRTIYGKTDLPYYNGDSTFTYTVKTPVNLPTSTAAPSLFSPAMSNAASTRGIYPDEAGTGALVFAPTVWNPYDVNSAQVSGGLDLAPSQLRIVLSNPLPLFNLAPANPWPPQPGWIMNASNPWRFDVWDTFQTPPDGWNAPLGYAYSGYHIDYTNTPAVEVWPTVTWGTPSAKWDSEEATALLFKNVDPSDPNTRGLYREPTLLIRKTTITSSGTDKYMELKLGAAHHISSLNPDWSDGIPEVSGEKYIGELLGTFPLRWTAPANAVSGAADYGKTYIYTVDQIRTLTPNQHATWRMEYLPPGAADVPGNWIPYQEKLVDGSSGDTLYVPGTPQDGSAAHPYLLTPNNTAGGTSGSIFYGSPNERVGKAYATAMASEAAWDPRTDRWCTPGDMNTPKFLNVDNTSTTDPNKPPTRLITETMRPNGTAGGGTHSMTIPGWSRGPNGPNPGILSQNLSDVVFPAISGGYFFCYGPDKVVRRASGGLNQVYATSAVAPSATASGTSTIGLPLVPVTNCNNVGVANNVSNAANRPVMLHRPYRTVAELGYVFSDTPWTNIDFSVPESGYTGLLDLFCVDEDTRSDALMAGKVDLNTRQNSVLAALMTNAYREVLSPTPSLAIASSQAKLADSEAATMAAAMFKRNMGVFAFQGKLANISELVGRYTVAAPQGANNNNQPFDGFSKDVLTASYPQLPNDLIQRFREAPIRALSSQGQAGTWNLMIDLIAQTGRYPATATTVANFSVEGERRYWVHVAIDRQSGQVIDQQIEQVNE